MSKIFCILDGVLSNRPLGSFLDSVDNIEAEQLNKHKPTCTWKKKKILEEIKSKYQKLQTSQKLQSELVKSFSSVLLFR